MVFYRGELARAIVESVRARGGILTARTSRPISR
jgi:gamma-glutamyltranspeptidase